MASSSTEIANLALSHLGTGVEIANLTTEKSQEANACNRFYNVARRATLRDAMWPFATKFQSLGLVSSNPTDEWAYSYQYPSDCLKMRRILSGIRNDTRQSRVPYRLVYGTASTEIYTDEQNAVAEYTIDIEQVSRFTPDFDMAFSMRLALYVIPRLSKGDPFKIRNEIEALYRFEISKAQANSYNELQLDQEPDSEFIRARET